MVPGQSSKALAGSECSNTQAQWRHSLIHCGRAESSFDLLRGVLVVCDISGEDRIEWVLLFFRTPNFFVGRQDLNLPLK